MKLTGKCREDFEKWYILNRQNQRLDIDGCYTHYTLFAIEPFTMQYGVYVDFFDSVGINITITRKAWVVTPNQNGYCDSRSEARTAAIEKANEIYNSKG
jgi:hypothetical protein